MENREYVKMFFRFLKDRGCYTQYFRNFNGRSITPKRFLERFPPKDYILSAFPWYKTPEEKDRNAFWFYVNRDWLYTLKMYLEEG